MIFFQNYLILWWLPYEPSIHCTFRHSPRDLQYLIQILAWLVVPDTDSRVTYIKNTGFYKQHTAARLPHCLPYIRNKWQYIQCSKSTEQCLRYKLYLQDWNWWSETFHQIFSSNEIIQHYTGLPNFKVVKTIFDFVVGELRGWWTVLGRANWIQFIITSHIDFLCGRMVYFTGSQLYTWWGCHNTFTYPYKRQSLLHPTVRVSCP